MNVKICGTTSVADALLSQNAGANFLGVILNHPPSPRNTCFETALEIKRAVNIPLVTLTVNQHLETLLEIAAQLKPHALQMHGDESPELVRELTARGFRIWKAISGDEKALFEAAQIYHDAGAEAILVDARESNTDGVIYGGTGKLADWNAARRLVNDGFRVILAGGLSPENVKRAVETVRPWGVDVVSGVEGSKGVKDAEKVRDFVINARD